jgi:hypothetical protein
VTTTTLAYGRNLAIKKKSFEILRILGHSFPKNQLRCCCCWPHFFSKNDENLPH